MKRSPNKSEQALWDRFKRHVRICVDLQGLNQLLMKQLNISYSFAKIWDVPIPQKLADEYTEFKERLEGNRKNTQILARLLVWVEAGELSIQKRGNDIDIVGPPGLNADELAHYRTGGLGALWVLIGIAALVFATAVAGSYHLWRENRKLTKRLDIVVGYANREFCKHPGSSMCEAWKERKQESDWVDNVTIAESIKNDLMKLGAGIGKGLKYGALIALPLLVLYFIAKRETR